MKLASRMSLHEDEEYHMTNHPMVEVPLESDQAGFEAAVGKDGNEMENGDTQKYEKEGISLDLAKRRKKLTENGVSFKLSSYLEAVIHHSRSDVFRNAYSDS